MKKSVVMLSVALLVAAIGVAWLWNELQAARSRNASMELRIGELMVPRTQEPAPALPVAQSVPAAPAGAVTPGAAAVAGNAASARAMLRMTLPQRYPDLAEELGLRPEELERLFDLLAEQNAGTPQTRTTTDAAIAELLGTRMADWQQYQRTLSARLQVNQLRGQLAASGSSLPQSRVRPLIEALNAAQEQHRALLAADPLPRTLDAKQRLEAQLQREKAGHRLLMDAAAPFLDPRQQAAYQRMLEQQMALATSMVPLIDAAQAQAAGPK